MKKIKLFIKISRGIALGVLCSLLLVNLILYIVYYFNNSLVENSGKVYLPYIIAFSILLFLNIIALVYLYEITFYEYEYEDLRIAIYSGSINHYLYVNDLIADSYRCSVESKTIYLRCKINNHRVEAIIPLLSGVKLIIDGKYIKRAL